MLPRLTGFTLRVPPRRFVPDTSTCGDDPGEGNPVDGSVALAAISEVGVPNSPAALVLMSAIVMCPSGSASGTVNVAFFERSIAPDVVPAILIVALLTPMLM